MQHHVRAGRAAAHPATRYLVAEVTPWYTPGLAAALGEPDPARGGALLPWNLRLCADGGEWTRCLEVVRRGVNALAAAGAAAAAQFAFVCGC